MMSTFAPEGLKWTYDDYAQIPEDGRRHEIIDGEHFVNPSPSTLHQHVSKRLQYQLYTKIELAGMGVLFDAPMDVQLSELDIVHPDLVIILDENVRKITPSNMDDDRTTKRDLYERFGVKEYWVVDPFEQQVDLDTVW